jgi:peptide/nickel transport system substrate-binding protein
VFRRWSWALAGVLALALFAGACGSDDKDTSGSTSATAQGGQAAATQTASGTQQAANIKRGGTLIVALDLNPKVFDPRVFTDTYSSRIAGQVFDTLVKLDEKLEPQPWLAEKVEQPDNLNYVFTLRKGIKFHDGTEMDAESVKFSVDRIREFKTGPAYADSQYIADTVVVDKYTFKLTLKEPYAPFLSILDGRIGQVVSPAAVKKLGDEGFGNAPVGTGPFKFAEFKSDSLVRVTKNEGYWKMGADNKALPYLDGIEFRIITESTARLTALQAGDVHISSIRSQDYTIVEKDSSLNLKELPGFNWSGLLLTIDKPPFDNKALRQAFAYGIDRDEIVKVILEGHGAPAQSPVPIPMEWARDNNFKLYSYDPAKVKAKLAEGGKPNGFEFTAYFSSGDSTTQQLAELMQAQLKKVGITMNLEFADFNGVVIPKAKANDPGAFAIGFSCTGDPDGCVSARFLKDSGFNYNKYANAEVSKLILDARVSTNREERAKLYKQVVPLIADDSPFIFTTHGVNRYVGNKKVQNWHIYEYPRLTQGYSEYWLN